MWKCLIFFDAFKKGRRVLSRDQTIKIFQTLFSQAAAVKNIPPIETNVFDIEELKILSENQNIFKSLFVPALGVGKDEYNQNITGTAFVEFDPLMENIVNSLIYNNKSIYKSSNVADSYVQNILSNRVVQKTKNQFKVGDIIDIIDGSYLGIPGKIEEIQDDNYLVGIQIFGSVKIIQLKSDQFKKIE